MPAMQVGSVGRGINGGVLDDVEAGAPGSGRCSVGRPPPPEPVGREGSEPGMDGSEGTVIPPPGDPLVPEPPVPGSPPTDGSGGTPFVGVPGVGVAAVAPGGWLPRVVPVVPPWPGVAGTTEQVAGTGPSWSAPAVAG